MTNGERLANIRKEKGLSQYRLGKLSGVKQGAISNYETGKREVGLETLKKICPALGISVWEFLGPNALENLPEKADPRIESIIKDIKQMNGYELRMVEGLVETIKKGRQE